MAKRRHSKLVVAHREKVSSLDVCESKRTFPVCWGFPMDELCFSLWVSNLLYLPILPYDSKIITISTYLSEARNFIHNAFLEIDDEWLVMLDSDVLPPPTFLDRLLSHGKLMVGGWYKKKGGSHAPVVYDAYRMLPDGKVEWKAVDEKGKGLQKVAAAGAGCWLMNKKVAKAIGKSPYDTWRGGEDLEMCLKVAEKGFDIYIDWDVACAHAGVAVV